LLNYRRDDLWDAATWADIDQAVLDEVQKVRVARKVFHTEDLSASGAGVPSWLSRAQVKKLAGENALYIPEGDAHPFVEISVWFQLTPAQAEAESTLHTARTLARMAAKSVAMAEDYITLANDPVNWAAAAPNVPPRFPPRAMVANKDELKGVVVGGQKEAEVKGDRALTEAQKLLNTVTAQMAALTSAGWPDPFALILGQELYKQAHSRLDPNSAETAEHHLRGRVAHLVASGVLPSTFGILVSLAGDSITIYGAQEATTLFIGETLTNGLPFYRFRVSERFQFVISDPEAIIRLKVP